jgi:hypothetical protein
MKPESGQVPNSDNRTKTRFVIPQKTSLGRTSNIISRQDYLIDISGVCDTPSPTQFSGLKRKMWGSGSQPDNSNKGLDSRDDSLFRGREIEVMSASSESDSESSFSDLESGSRQVTQLVSPKTLQNFERKLNERRHRQRLVGDKSRGADLGGVFKGLPNNASGSRIASFVIGKEAANSSFDSVAIPSSSENVSLGTHSLNEENLEDDDWVDGESDDLPKVRGRKDMLSSRLEDENIRKTSRKYCCKGHCLINLDVKGIRLAREMYFRQKSQDRSLALQWMLKRREGDGENSTQLKFNVGDISVCRQAFKAVFCVGNDRIARIAKANGGDVLRLDLVGRPRNMKTLVLIEWLRDFFKTRVESLPNKNILHLPDNYTKWEICKLFNSQYGTRDETTKVQYEAFTRIWRQNFPHVKIPPVSRFSACADCEEFKTIRDKAISNVEKGMTPLLISN